MHTAEADWVTRARETLDQAGLKRGGARDKVVELLSRQRCFLSAQEMVDRLRAEDARVGTASVYRALELLHELGLVQRVDLGEGGYRYEPVVPGGEHHHHAVCDLCGRVTAFEDAGLERAIDRLERSLGHTVAAHEVVLRGECSSCERVS